MLSEWEKAGPNNSSLGVIFLYFFFKYVTCSLFLHLQIPAHGKVPFIIISDDFCLERLILLISRLISIFFPAKIFWSLKYTPAMVFLLLNTVFSLSREDLSIRILAKMYVATYETSSPIICIALLHNVYHLLCVFFFF